MASPIQDTQVPVHQTITGGRLSLSNLSPAECTFLELVAKRYDSRQDWTRFGAWWNAEFKAAGLTTSSVLYRVCQDLEARLGIDQGKVSPPDYRDYLAERIDTKFGSRQEFCKAPQVDPGQLSRVLANRADLSLKVLLKVLEVLDARLVIQTAEDSRVQTSVARAVETMTAALAERETLATAHPEGESPACPTSSVATNAEPWDTPGPQWVSSFPMDGYSPSTRSLSPDKPARQA